MVFDCPVGCAELSRTERGTEAGLTPSADERNRRGRDPECISPRNARASTWEISAVGNARPWAQPIM